MPMVSGQLYHKTLRYRIIAHAMYPGPHLLVLGILDSPEPIVIRLNVDQESSRV